MRDKRKNEEFFKGFLQDIEDDIKKRLGKMDRIESMNPIASVNIPWALYEFYTERMQVRYCLGDDIPSFAEDVLTALDWLQIMNDNGAKLQDREDQEYFADKIELSISVLFSHFRWLAFAISSGIERRKIKQAIDLIGHAGSDRLFDLIMIQLGETNRKVGERVVNSKLFNRLFGVVEAPEVERPGLMKAFLEDWMSLLKKEGFEENHEKDGYSYQGYWCYEAALVVMLWNIDDSSFRNNPYYPKDLVRKL
jgi:hypothetical protein